jgi:serine phosphatase RsbU (regulator of sigma subunit)
VTAAAVLLTTGGVLSVSTVAERNARRDLAREVETRLLLEARNLALTSSEALLTDFPELTLHPLLKEMTAKEPEIAIALVVDRQGVIQGDPNARELGAEYRPKPTLKGIKATQALTGDEALLGDAEVILAYAPIVHRSAGKLGMAIVGLKRSYLEEMFRTARQQQTLVLVFFLVVGTLAAFLLMALILRPIAALRSGIERIAHGNLDAPIRLRDRTELGLLAVAINDMAADLKRAQAEMVERERLAHEVELARQIQRSLLPDQQYEAEDFVIAGSQRAAAEVGGDYYDFFSLPDGRVGIAVADVSGKGLAGCLVMSMLSALLRAFRASHLSPSAMLAALDERLGESLRPGSFVTMFYGVLEPREGRLVYASAGHNPVLMYRASNQSVEWIRSGGIPLGAVRRGAIRKTLQDSVVELASGDVLVQFTDGINEAFDRSGKVQFGFDRMSEAVKASAPVGCHAVIEGLQTRVRNWVGDGPPLDDETILVVARSAAKAAERTAPPSPALAPPSLATVPRGPRATETNLEPHGCFAEARLRGRHLVLAPDLDALPGIREWLEHSFDHDSLDPEQFEVLSTALYEACANIVEHGKVEGKAQEIELWWVPGSGEPTAVTPGASRHGRGATPGYFLLRDHGRPFSADNWKRTDFADPQARRRKRGFGLDIIHRVMKVVSYHPGTTLGNITLMIFESDPRGGQQEEARSA